MLRVGVTAFLTDRSMGPAEFGRAVEERGYASLFLPEHTHLPVEEAAPPSLVGGVTLDDYRRTMDPFVALSAAAAVTSRIELGTGVSLVAQHDPIVLAKQVATVDHISGGRFVLGVGFGWNRQEAADHGVDFSVRREVAAEKLRCMRALWTDDVAQFQGEHVQLPPSFSWPKPVRVPPVLFGGAPGPRTFATIAELGDGWMPIGGAGVAQAMVELRASWEKAGRDPAGMRVMPFGTIPDDGKMARFAKSGITDVVLRIPSGPAAQMLQKLDEYSRYL